MSQLTYFTKAYVHHVRTIIKLNNKNNKQTTRKRTKKNPKQIKKTQPPPSQKKLTNTETKKSTEIYQTYRKTDKQIKQTKHVVIQHLNINN